jgi:hypothetical protein
MRKPPAAVVGLAVFLAGPTLAQAASESAKMTGQDQTQSQSQAANGPAQMNGQGQNQGQNNQSIRQQVKNNLEQAGFSDIKIMPQSFLVRAKDRNGNPMMMVLNPDSVTAVTEYKGQTNNTTGNNTTGNNPARNNNPTGNED